MRIRATLAPTEGKEVPLWAESCLCASVISFICTWCVETSTSSQVNPLHHLREWRQTSDTFPAVLQTLPNFCGTVAITALEINILPAPRSDWSLWPAFPGSLNTPAQSAQVPRRLNWMWLQTRTTTEAARYLTAASPEAPKPCWEMFLAGESQTEPPAHTPASVSHGLLGLWLSSETCFPGGEVSSGEMTAHTVDEHRWR